ncbi:MAG: carboxypeptidase-like regulatory domain-containing protein [Bacteroidales bacterium]|jgi:hypothetical protein|nr:carboxypeptidase-like regulatory domain-containing protein [Bacteroidales bacterium]
MRNMVLRYQKYFQIDKLFVQYEALFEGNTADQEAKAAYAAKLTEIATIISYLMQPMSPQYKVRKSSREALREQARLLTGRGIALANHLQETEMGHLMHAYHSNILKASSFELKERCLHIHSMLLAHAEALVDFGLNAAQLTAFSELTENFDTKVGQAVNSLSLRKAKREQVWLLLKETSQMLKQQFDSFAQLQKDSAPEFYTRYQALRRRRPRYRSTDAIVDPSDISGMVRDGLTGAPVANATVNLLEHSFVVITDGDGLYFLEELPPGNYTVSCHAAGYAVPDVVTVELSNNDSVVVNFDLEAIAATA